MRVDILTIFPELFHSSFNHGIIRRAQNRNLVKINVHNLRDFTYDRHHVVDDRPFSGGEGMVLKPEPIFRAIDYLTHDTNITRAVCLLTPQGKTFCQQMARDFSQLAQLILLCGRYEGIDERVNQALVTHEVSIGDYVLSGGEFAALPIVDAVVRLLPGALGCADSTANESFSNGLFDYPVYTRPATYRGLSVPFVLQNGNHQEIARWRRYKCLEKTYHLRPDLLTAVPLTDEDKKMLKEIRKVSTIPDEPESNNG